jgi:hypothetical protein
MLDLEWLCHPQTYVTDSYNKVEDFQICYDLNSNAIHGISESIAHLQPNIASFDFFDLMLSDYDHYVLSKVKIKDFSILVPYSELNHLQNEINAFLNEVLDQPQEGFISGETAKIAIRLISNIIAASGHHDAVVSMIAYNNGMGDYFPCWHVDKTHREEITGSSPEKDLEDTQNVFIITLKGPSTLYQHTDENLRQQFNVIANETSHSYGYGKGLDYVPGEGLDKLFNIMNSRSADFGWGSVHLAGHTYGAVHATPPGEERLVMIITPGDKSTIDELKK